MVLIRDGTLYFVALSLLNTADIVIAATSNTSSLAVTNIVLLILPLSSILITRFLLDIREAASYSRIDVRYQSSYSDDHVTGTSVRSEFTTLEFVGRIVRNPDTQDIHESNTTIGPRKDVLSGTFSDGIMQEDRIVEEVGEFDEEVEMREIIRRSMIA